MSSNSSSCSQGWSAPPVGILSRILSLADIHSRFTAALVCSHWAEAAAVATRAIYCSPEHKAAVDALHQYLGKHGQHITSLHFDTESFTDWYLFQGILIEQLPCPNLLDFGFQGDGWQLLPAGGTPHLLCACKSLTRLSLYTNDEVPGMLPSLSVLTDLRQLRSLEVVTYSSDDAPPAELEDSLDGDVLAQLPHLTKLQLAGEVRITTLRHISCLTALQELQVQLEYPVAEAEGSSAPQEHSQQQQQQQRAVLQHLTDLRLGAPGLLISSSTYPWLADLPALRHAVYTVGLLEPQVVSAAPQLTALTVTALTDIAGGASGLREFLSSLRSLQQLTCCSLEASSTAADILVPDACSCLTASSRLQKLSLFGWSFPIGGWQHMFPAGVQLGLTYQDLRGAQGERINTDALQRLVQCCPDLRELVLVQATQRSNIDLGPLMQLSALTKLELGSILDPVDVSIRAVEWSSAVNCLKQLPSLRHLVMATSDVLLLTETLELTVLTDLSHLQLYILQDRTVIRQSWEEFSGGTVWYQLLLSTLKDSDCRDLLLQREAAVLEQLQQGGQDPRLVHLALQEARARAELLLLQIQLDHELEAATQAFYGGSTMVQR